MTSPASDFQWIFRTPELSLAYWETYDPESKVDLSSIALETPEGILFISPAPLAPEAYARLTEGKKLLGTLLNNINHERAAESFPKPIYAPKAGQPGFTLPSLHWFDEESELPAGLKAIALPGGPLGETALYTPANGGLLIIGDALINLPKYGFIVLPEKYCIDINLLKNSLSRLKNLPVQTVAFAHGRPLHSEAQTLLRALLEEQQ